MVRILGIAGSPREDGNTERLVKKALAAARSVGGVETEFVSLAGKTINPCRADYECFLHPCEEAPCRTYIQDQADECNDILVKMLKADGFIVGCPVYWGGPPAQMKALMDRSMANEALGFALRNKVAGAIAVAADRNGGQESTVIDLIKWFLTHDMIVVGVGPERPKTSIGSYYGACVVQGFPFPVDSLLRESRSASEKDEIGMNAVISLGKRVAELTKIVRAGITALPEKELAWPQRMPIEAVE